MVSTAARRYQVAFQGRVVKRLALINDHASRSSCCKEMGMSFDALMSLHGVLLESSRSVLKSVFFPQVVMTNVDISYTFGGI